MWKLESFVDHVGRHRWLRLKGDFSEFFEFFWGLRGVAFRKLQRSIYYFLS